MDNKNLILAVVLSVALLWGYTTFIAPPPPKPGAPVAEQAKDKNGQTASAPAAPGAASGVPAALAPAATPAPVKESREVVVETPQAQYTFSERGGALRKVLLKKYFMEPGQKGGHLVLLDLAKSDPYSLGLSLPKLDPQLGLRHFEASAASLKVDQGGQPQSLTFRAQSAGLGIEKIYTFKSDSYAFDLKVKLTNLSGQAMEFASELSLHEYAKKGEVNTYAFTGMLGWRDHRLVEHGSGDLKDEAKVESGAVQWMAMSIPYFMGAVAPEGKDVDQVKRSLRGTGTGKDGIMTATLVEPMQTLSAGEAQEQSFLVFYGPRDLDVLETLGHNLAAAVDFGWFDLIAKPMLAALNFFERYSGNYGIAIIIITILIKILLWPVAAKSYKSMKKMQELQPVLAKLRERYKDDRERLQQETMQLYKTYKVNPLGGCLPMVVQFPVFIAFYKVLGSAIELRHAPFMLWINDLAAPDRLPLGFDFAIPYVQQGYGLPVLTILMGGSMFLQQKMTPSTGDPTQAKMMLMMPVVFTFMFLNFPSGLVLYWLVQGVLSIGQQYWTNQQKSK
jgi:YidC/Oxa1 family membrane protein insertase